MDHETQKPAPDNETTFTLYRFCLCHGLALETKNEVSKASNSQSSQGKRGSP